MLSRSDRHRVERIARGRGDEGLHVLEGAKAVRDALQSGVVSELLVRRDLDAALRAELVDLAEDRGVLLREGSRQDFDRMTRTVTPQGVLALVRDTARSLEEVIHLGLGGLLLWLDGVQDPGNVGAVFRAAAGLGAAGVFVGEGSADPLGLKALRASTGRALTLPFARGASSEIGASLDAGDVPVWTLDARGDDLLALRASDLPGRLALVVGREGSGVGDVARRAARRRVGIPLEPGVDSLNAAVAAGIAVAHLGRRLRERA